MSKDDCQNRAWNCLLVGDHPSASFHTIRRGSTVFQLESQVYEEKPPKQFALKDGIVALRGVSPDIDVEASELEVRSAIADVIKNSGDEFIACSRYSFEFIEANSKNLYVPENTLVFSGQERQSKI